MKSVTQNESFENELGNIHKEHIQLLEAIEHHNCAMVHDLIHLKNISPNVSVEGKFPLCRAAHGGFVDILDILVEGGCNLNAADSDMWKRQSMHIASSKGHVKFVRRLLEYGAKVDVRDDDQRTPLHWAATYGNPEMAEFLISQGASVNVTQCDGFTPLHAATCLGHNHVCKVLLAHGAEINQTDRDGWTSFHTAVCYGHIDVVKTLLEAGASLFNLTSDEENVIHIAASSGKVDVAKLLIHRGAKINEYNISGYTPFHLSVYYNETKMVTFLMKIGADMYLTKDSTKTPFQLAAVRGQVDLMLLFLQAGYNLSREEWLLKKDFPIVLQKVPELCQFLFQKASNPFSLKEICRDIIRGLLKYDDDFESTLKLLRLPLCLENFVSYDNLDKVGNTWNSQHCL